MRFNILIISILVFQYVGALDNGLAKTPAMGWNSWNKFACNINENLIKNTADALVSSGLLAAGYKYLNLDDCWQRTRDPKTGRILVDSDAFPSGMDSLVKYVHQKGLLFGLYSDAGFLTCQGRPGSLGFEEIDAQQYAEWDVDYLKYDNCFTDKTSPKVRYPPMSKALQKQKKQIYFSMCEWGVEDPATWAGELANSWRTTGDIEDKWESFLSILDQQVGLEGYGGPGGWNDPDMLEVGNGGMTTTEYQSHFALWSLLKAPLLIGCDVTIMSDDTKRILMNEEVIAVNQDSLGKQGRRVWKDGDSEVWATEVVDGTVVVLFNRSTIDFNLTIYFSNLDLKYSQAKVRDLISKKDFGLAKDKFTSMVPSHGVVMVKFSNAQQTQ